MSARLFLVLGASLLLSRTAAAEALQDPSAPAREEGFTLVEAVRGTHPLCARQVGDDLWLGGPVVALGLLSTGDAFTGDARLAVGYEIAAPSFLIYRLSLESDVMARQGHDGGPTDRDVLLVPVAEITSPSLPLGPDGPGMFAVAAGVGTPLTLGPEPRIGLRLEANILFRVIGLVNAFDYDATDGWKYWFTIRASM